MSVFSDIPIAYRAVRRGVRRRKYRNQVLTELEAPEDVAPGTYQGAIYFPDSRKNLYQLRQWLKPMEVLSEHIPLVIMTRSASAALQIREETSLPVLWFRYISQVEEFVDLQSLGIVFYVNQSAKNFQMLGFPTPAHVHINHGESDKISMASNHMKAYDFAFIAGDAAQERITKNLIGIDNRHLVKIGRPQIDNPPEGPELPSDERTVVLYSPTWEGDRPGMAYGSIVSHGLKIVKSLLADDTVRLIYRPHPRTGTANKDYGRAADEIVQTIELANKQDPSAQHLIDLHTPFGWQTGAADVCICDISAVAFDWLATGKPLVMTRPVSEDAVVDTEGLVANTLLMDANDASAAAKLVQDIQAGGMGDAYAKLVEYYFGDVANNNSTKRFIAASKKVVKDRVKAQTERESRLSRVIGH